VRPGEGAGLEDGLAGEVGLVGVEVGAERAGQARERREHLGVGPSRRRVGGGRRRGSRGVGRRPVRVRLAWFGVGIPS
jgi:hypothetical protein